MPSYLYLCSIHGEFEEMHSIRDDAKLSHCLMCKKENNTDTPVERLINGGGSGRGIVELTGRDLIDKAKTDAVSFKKEVHQKESLYANVLGESKYESLQRRIDKQKR